MSWKRVRWIGLVLLLGWAGAGRLAADMAADLASVAIEAAGGRAAHAGLRGLRATGVTRVGETEVKFILHAERPRRLRIETLGEKRSLVRAFDGVRAPWMQAGAGTQPLRMGAAEERDFVREADFDSPLYEHTQRGIGLDYAGESELDGRPVQKLLATLDFTEMVTLFLDDETHLLTRRETTRTMHGRAVVVRTDFSDYRECRGVQLPRRIRTSVNGKLVSETTITQLQPNPKLPADFFAPPVSDWPIR